MKAHFFVLTLLLATTSAMFGQKAGTQTITIKTNIYCDHCMKCGTCGVNINEHIHQANKGIKKVAIDAEKSTITVTYRPIRTSPDKIRAAINAAGFDADDSKAPAATVKKLDACCLRPEPK